MSSSITDGHQPTSPFIQLTLRAVDVLELHHHQPFIKPYVRTSCDRSTMMNIMAYPQEFLHLKRRRMILHLLAKYSTQMKEV